MTSLVHIGVMLVGMVIYDLVFFDSFEDSIKGSPIRNFLRHWVVGLVTYAVFKSLTS